MTRRRGSPKPVAFAIDAGGTKVQAAFVAADGGVTDHVVAPADWSDQGGAMVEQILALATGAVRRRPDVAAVGVAATGVFSPDGRVVAARPGRERWLGVPLAERIGEATGRVARAANDSQLMTLGEWRFGSGRGSRTLLGVALGTGLGGGVVADGRLLSGAFGGAGEIGHVTVDLDGRPCNCGRSGCVEAYVAGPAIAARYAEATGLGLATPEVCDRAERGEAAARRLLDRVVAELAAALVSVVAVVNPDRVVVGGGLGSRLSGRLPELTAAMRGCRLLPPSLLVVGAGLGLEAPLFGAAALALEPGRA